MSEDRKHEFKRRLYRYVLRLIKFLTRIPADPVLLEIKRQLTRSGTSIGANYFEAQSASSRKDFQNYFSHSLKSATESRFWLALLRDCELLAGELRAECIDLLDETRQLANILASSILTMKSKR